MRRYIDADKAKNGVMEFVDKYGEIVGMSVTDFNILLERCAADVAEVVRCRDCVMWDGSFTLNGQKKCLNVTFCTDGDFYCGWGTKE